MKEIQRKCNKIRTPPNFDLDHELREKFKSIAIEANPELKKKYTGKSIDQTDEGTDARKQILSKFGGKKGKEYAEVAIVGHAGNAR